MSDGDGEKPREGNGTADSQAARRAQLLKLAAAGFFLVIIAVVVVIVVAGSGGGSSGNAENVVDVAAVEKLLDGIPQHGNVLGQASAPVTLFEYGDLQCPFCKAFSEEVLPQVIGRRVRSGEVKLAYRDFVIIGPESVPAGEAALAAGAQGKGWTFIQLFYRNQGEENSGYVTEKFIESIGRGAGIGDLEAWNKARKSGRYKKVVEATTAQANRLGFSGTPSFAVRGPGSKGLELLGTPESTEELEEAIDRAS